MNKLKKFTNWKTVLLGILCLAALLRLYAISSTPVSIYWDETAIGYNAFSIAQTGRDEYGKLLPLLFRSFDDYKLPGYIYVTAVFVKLFGLSAFSVRIGSALFGIGTVALTYFLVKELFSQQKISAKRFQFLQTHLTQLSLLSAGLLAISPWHLQFSRTGFEANGALFCIVSGMFFLLKGIRTKTPYLLAGTVLLALSLYFYRSAVVFAPLLFVTTLLICGKELFVQSRKLLLVTIVVAIIIALPILTQLVSPQGNVRFSQVAISQDVHNYLVQNASSISSQGNSFTTRILYNRRILFAKEFVSNYISHFSPAFLFVSGDPNGRHHVSGMGQLYVWEILFILVGLYLLWYLPWKTRLFIISWIILAPLPAAITTPAPHALRSLQMLPMPQLLTAMGIVYAYSQLAKKKAFGLYTCALLLVIVFSLSNYMYSYYVITPPKTADDWADGYKQLTSYIIPKASEYNTVIVTGHYWQPYIYFLFYSQYDPRSFQKNGSAIRFANYYFGGTSWDQNKGRQELDKEDLYSIAKGKRTLVALSPQEYTAQKNNLANVHTITNSYGKEMFLVGELQ